MNGLLLLDKPAGLTSHDVVARLRTQTGIRKIGHGGTLDPFATGLLLVLLGRATRLSRFFLGMPKQYQARFRLGEESDTMDVTGKIQRRAPVDVSPDQLRQVLCSFTGEIEQVPPMYSAIKVDGRKLYEIARKGKTMERSARKVTIFELQLSRVEPPDVEISMQCSSGTYVRSLVHDIGKALGCGALVTELRRSAAGPYRLEQALRLPCSTEQVDWASFLIPMERLLPELSRRVVSGPELDCIRHGRDLSRTAEDVRSEWVRLFDPEERLVALGRVEESRIHPSIVLT